MASIEQVKQHFNGSVCRRCINNAYKVNLTRGDCHYYYYPRNCACCKEMKNIVSGFTISGRVKMIFK